MSVVERSDDRGAQLDGVRRERGRLKIFLGYAPGVGKTYAMLDAARQRLAEGWDVVLGCVDTHGQADTEALLRGFEDAAGTQVQCLGALPCELNVDDLLARRPRLAVVDDLAHANAPASRHPKRYLDVQDLLAHGMDVYSTLDIQSLESFNDVVAQITGVRVSDTIPDWVLDDADEIELVDLSTHELVRRLEEGKVSVPDQAARTIRRFYRYGNLAALREMSLRKAAMRVDEQMRSYMDAQAIAGPWPAHDRLLVCVGAGRASERLIRATRRMAAATNAEWFAVHVEVPEGTDSEGRHAVAQALSLAEELGAHAVMLPGQDVAGAVLDYARSQNITGIIVGKPLRPWWRDLTRPSSAAQMIRKSGDIDVFVLGGAPDAHAARRSGPPVSWPYYVYAALVVLAVTVFGLLTRSLIAPTNLVMLYLLAVVIAALRWGRGPSILVACVSVLLFDFFFVPPHFTLAIANTQYLLTFLGLLVVGLVVSNLAAQAREQAANAQSRELQTSVLYGLSRDLAASGDLDGILASIVAHVEQTFMREVTVLLVQDGELKLQGASANSKFDQTERVAAAWALEHGQPAGRGTDTFPEARARYLPLTTARGAVGVLSVRPPSGGSRLTPDQRQQLEAFASLSALAIERARLADAALRADLLEATERLQSALLNSISHDLRTPLASITGALSSLRDKEVSLDEATRNELIDNSWLEAERLNHFVGNLLDMTRLESGAVHLRMEPCDIQELIGAALGRFSAQLRDRPLDVKVGEDLPLVPMDFVLITQVLVNLLDNALKYSSPGTPITVCAEAGNDQVAIEVSDRGTGIPPADLARVFDKFFRVQRSGSVAGTGLGLAIARGIVEAHGGTIAASNRIGGGTTVLFALPLDPASPAMSQEAP